MKFYRYEFRSELGNQYNREDGLAILTFNLIKETPCGYWIAPEWDTKGRYKKWVSKTARKRYAYPDKEQALIAYIKRTKRRMSILKYQIELCETGLSIANKIK